MTLTPVGYLPKRELPAPEFLASSGAAEICCVSECLTPAPPGWTDRWLHNEWGFLNSVEDALSVLPPERAGYRVLAFSLLDRRFTKGSSTRLSVDAPAIEPLPAGFVALGFDVVSRSTSDFFECSPLSCNSMALEIPVNRYCLIDDVGDAERAAARFSHEKPEPGDYFVLQVWREGDGINTP